MIDIAALVQADRNLVDDLKATALTDFGFDFLSLIRADIVLCEDAFYRLQTISNHLFVV
ncbi:hypothetical protein D3C75_1355790 [compost metagenome]